MRLGQSAIVGYLSALTVMASPMAANPTPGGGRIIDSHIHVWTPDVEHFPRASGAPQIPNHLEPLGTIEAMHRAMTAAGVAGTLIVQPVNYGQDYSYMREAFQKYPGFFKGMLVADPSAENPETILRDIVASSPDFWVGVRFNPYKWTDAAMADDVGKSLFATAGELRLPVGFMPFKGLATHVEAIETLMKSSPATIVIIDHWGFHVQPATGFGDDRLVQEEHWENLLRLGREYPQVHVKLSGAFRNTLQPFPFADLQNRLERLVEVFSAKRLLWGSDAPYFLDFGEYSHAVGYLTNWSVWKELLNEEQRADILHRNSERLFGAWGSGSSVGTATAGSEAEL